MTARYAPGDRVRVGDEPPEGHHRTPGFVQGRSGVVTAVRGACRNPESRDLWDGYRGGPRDAVYVDLFEHWLQVEEG